MGWWRCCWYQLVDGLGRRDHAEGRRHHHHRTESTRTVQFHAVTHKTLLQADTTVRFRVAQLLGRKHARHAVMASDRPREAIVTTQGRTHLGGQWVVEGTVQVTDLDLRRIDLPARATGGDDLNLAALAPGNQCRLGVDTVDAVDHTVDLRGDVLGHGLAGDEIRHRMHATLRVDALEPLGHDLDPTLARPTVLSRACNWRLLLLTQTSSRSNREISPTPQRAMASAAQDPTPPTPTMAT